MVKLGKITIHPVETKLQLADAMTKALPRPQHEFLMEKYCGSTADFLVGVLDSQDKNQTVITVQLQFKPLLVCCIKGEPAWLERFRPIAFGYAANPGR